MLMNNLAGFSYYPNFITQEEEQNLINEIQLLTWQQVVLFGQIAKRRVVHFGMDYHYERRTVLPTQPIPEFLNEIKTRGAVLLKMRSEEIVEVLITEYPINAGIGWHRDAAVFEAICGISLNSSTVIQLRKRDDPQEQYKLFLERGSAYTLTNEVRWNWEHRIAPVKQLRYSITLRTLKTSKTKAEK
jgi:alkylated DNA repair dioxygenase AlkB